MKARLRRFHPSAGIAREARRLDRTVEQCGGLGYAPGRVHDVAQHRNEDGGHLVLSRRAGDREASLRVAARVFVAVQVQLGGGEVGQSVQAEPELVVRNGVHERCRLGAVGLRVGDGSHERGGDGQHRRARCGERRLGQPLRGGERTLTPVAHRVVVHAVKIADRELDHERHRLSRGRARQPTEGHGQPCARRRVVAEELLEPGAGADQPHADYLLIVGRQGDALEQSLAAVLEPPSGGLRSREGHEDLDPLFVRRAFGQQAERDPEPARRAYGRAMRRRLAGFTQHCDRGQVAVACGVLDVVRPHGGRRAARRERIGAALVRGEPHS